jgi:hypothetical protein
MTLVFATVHEFGSIGAIRDMIQQRQFSTTRLYYDRRS